MADEIHVPPDVWRLDAAPDAVDDAAVAWWRYSQAPQGIVDSITEAVGIAESWGWDGEYHDYFTGHLSRLARKVGRGGELAGRVDGLLTGVAGNLRSARSDIDASFGNLAVPAGPVSPNGFLPFYPADDRQERAVYDAIADAQETRRWLDRRLDQAATLMYRLAGQWQETLPRTELGVIPEEDLQADAARPEVVQTSLGALYDLAGTIREAALDLIGARAELGEPVLPAEVLGETAASGVDDPPNRLAWEYSNVVDLAATMIGGQAVMLDVAWNRLVSARQRYEEFDRAGLSPLP